jgi:hypothetical protein
MAKRIEAAPESPPLEPRLGGFKIQGPVRSAPAAKPAPRGAPSAKNNDGLWHCTNDEARGTVFVKGAARRSASTWPVPASASAVERPWSCTLPPELEVVRATVYSSAPIPAIPSASTAATSSCGALP